jgi:hypothetical protein
MARSTATTPLPAGSTHSGEVNMDDIDADIAEAEANPDAARVAMGALGSAFAQRAAASFARAAATALARAGSAPGLPIDLEEE